MDTYIEVEPGVKIFAQVEGKGKPKSIVLIHGWALTHDMWKLQVPYLQQHDYQVVAIDLRGFGASDKPPAGYSYHTWANDVETVIKKLDLQHITLVGYSIGGAIAMYYAATRAKPGIEKLTLVAAAGPYMTWDLNRPLDNVWGHTVGFWDALIFLVNCGRGGYAFQQFYESAFPKMDAQDVQWLKDMLASASPQAMIGGLEEIRNKDLRKDVSKISVQTRVFGGVVDPLVRYGLVEEQHHLIKDAKLTTFWRSGHCLFFEEADKLKHELDW